MDEKELIEKATKLIRRFDNMRIIGARGEWSGSARQGFAFNPQRGGGSAGIIPPPPEHSGACCHDGVCTILTPELCAEIGGEYQGDDTLCVDVDCGNATSGACCVGSDCSIQTPAGCAALGGTYQGDETTCDPNPCPIITPTGACCKSGVCDIETEADCIGSGGIYQGDDTTCDPNPCCCAFGFLAYDGSGRRFLTRTLVATWSQTRHTDFANSTCTFTGSLTDVQSYNSIDCSFNETCTGSYSLDNISDFGHTHEDGDPCNFYHICDGCGIGTPVCFLPDRDSDPACGDSHCSCSGADTVTCSETETFDDGAGCTWSCSSDMTVTLSDEIIC